MNTQYLMKFNKIIELISHIEFLFTLYIKMVGFFELQNSDILTDRVRFNMLDDILSQLFNVEHLEPNHIYRYSTQLETPKNHQIILNNWEMLFFGERQLERYKKNKRLVYWTICRLIELFNQKYSPEQPMSMTRIQFNKRSSEDNTKVITYTFHELVIR